MTAAETWLGAKAAGAAGMTARSCSLQRMVRRRSHLHRRQSMNIPRITSILVGCAFVSCTLSEKHHPRYSGYIGAPVSTKTPIWVYINENHQVGPGTGYVLKNYGMYGNHGLVGILPVGHPVTFTKAFQSYDFGGGSTWLEGSTIFKGKDYYVQMRLALMGESEKAAKELYDSFRPQ